MRGVRGLLAAASAMRLDTYLASPRNQLQAHAANGMSVLISFATFSDWHTGYTQSFKSLLIDSGAYSELNSGVCVDGFRYRDFMHKWEDRAVACAGLDDIGGNWRRSMKNYSEFGGFPTFHDTDPPELLEDLIPMARERGGWLGVGVKPPRQGKERFLRDTLERIPDDIHVHGWALRAYRHMSGFHSMDSTNWWRETLTYRIQFPWLTYGECLDIMVKRYQREHLVAGNEDESQQLALGL